MLVHGVGYGVVGALKSFGQVSVFFNKRGVIIIIIVIKSKLKCRVGS
jgi:hypothetical protein